MPQSRSAERAPNQSPVSTGRSQSKPAYGGRGGAAGGVHSVAQGTAAGAAAGAVAGGTSAVTGNGAGSWPNPAAQAALVAKIAEQMRTERKGGHRKTSLSCVEPVARTGFSFLFPSLRMCDVTGFTGPFEKCGSHVQQIPFRRPVLAVGLPTPTAGSHSLSGALSTGTFEQGTHVPMRNLPLIRIK